MTIPQAFALALQHHQAGRRGNAEALYRQILAADPCHADARHHLGIIAHQAGRDDLAIEWIREALVLIPNNPSAHFNLGEACRAQGQLDEAIASFHCALQLRPNWPEAHNNLGVALAAQGRIDEAMAAYRHALTLKPDYAEAHNNLGNALKERNQFNEAVIEYRQALQLKPSYPEACNNLGTVLAGLHQPDEAIAAYRRALALKSDFVEAHSNLGNALKDQGRLDEAVACYQCAIALNPRFPDAHLNMGVIAWLQGRFDEAEADYRRAIACRANFSDAHLNLGILLLLLGRYEEGWIEYEWRRHSPAHARRHHHFSAPLWDGTPTPGKTILIHAEQGFGDTLLFARYLPLIRAHSRAARVILDCQPTLVPLLKQLTGAQIDIVARDATRAALPQFDLQLPLLSLPPMLQHFAPLSTDGPYLQADAHLRNRWCERLGGRAELRVGLAWAGNPSQEDDHRRSIAADKLAPILRVPGVRFVSLQVEPRAPLPPPLIAAGVLDLTANITDFADSAALMAELDLIITVDTATAHLAGALGRPVWVLLPFVPYWPYGLEREDTPWYPTMRLFRQSCAGDWEAVLERVAAALRERNA